MLLLDRLIEIRIGGDVERCHTVRHGGSYSVAAHSWGVAVLMYLLWPQDFSRLVPYCIFHDVPEAWVGDVPAPMKKFHPQVKGIWDGAEDFIFRRLCLPNDAKLSLEDQRKLRACDHLELYLWAREQAFGGNHHVGCVCRELAGFFEATPLPAPADELFEQLVAGPVAHDLGKGYRALFPGS